MRYCDFTSLKVGDRVWSNRDGWLKIIDIDCIKDTTYPIQAVSDSGYEFSFTTEGKEYITDIYPAIFWNEFEIPKEAFEKPKPKLEVDTLVWVWDNYKDEKLLRFFSHFDEYGSIYTFDDGRDSSYEPRYTTEWNEWELYKPKKEDNQ